MNGLIIVCVYGGILLLLIGILVFFDNIMLLFYKGDKKKILQILNKHKDFNNAIPEIFDFYKEVQIRKKREERKEKLNKLNK